MRDNRRYIEPALQHRRHLVPGLEHLAAVDALDDEALEDHLVPVDGGVARRNAEQRHAAAVMHGPQQIPESGWVTRHLESDVEALDHSERLHRVVERLPRDVDRARCAHLSGELETVVVDVGHDDVPRAHEAGDGRCHDADRPGAGDQHVLAHEVEGESRVRRVAEWIENRGDLIADRVGQLEGVERRDHQVLREAPWPVDTDAHGVAAQVAPARAAVAAVAAGDVALARYPVADRETLHFAADLDDLAAVLMTDRHRHWNRLLCPGVPAVDVHVGAADRGLADLDPDVVGAELRLRYLLEPDPRGALRLHQCLHLFDSS